MRNAHSIGLAGLAMPVLPSLPSDGQPGDIVELADGLYEYLAGAGWCRLAVAFEHVQAVPAVTWTVTHNLGRYPSVTVIDTGGNVVLTQVSHLSINQLQIDVSAAFSGRALLN